MPPVPSSISPLPSSDVIVLCPEALTAIYREPLRTCYRVAITGSPDRAMDYVLHTHPPLMIVDGDSEDAPAVCDRARAVPSARRPSLLVSASNPENIGHLIDRCDSVLLRPFAPNLLAARVGRMLALRGRIATVRLASEQIRTRAAQQLAKSEHLIERSGDAGTLITWPNTHCPHCQHEGIVLFDYASLRRAWYACSACRKVWMAKRMETRGKIS